MLKIMEYELTLCLLPPGELVSGSTLVPKSGLHSSHHTFGNYAESYKEFHTNPSQFTVGIPFHRSNMDIGYQSGSQYPIRLAWQWTACILSQLCFLSTNEYLTMHWNKRCYGILVRSGLQTAALLLMRKT